MSDARPPDRDATPPDGDEEQPFIPRHVVPLLAESTLWPIWLVVMAHLAAFGAWSLLLAFEDGRLSAWLAAFGLAWLSATAAWAEIRQTGRPGAVGLAVALTWALTAVFFFGARYLDAF